MCRRVNVLFRSGLIMDEYLTILIMVVVRGYSLDLGSSREVLGRAPYQPVCGAHTCTRHCVLGHTVGFASITPSPGPPRVVDIPQRCWYK